VARFRFPFGFPPVPFPLTNPHHSATARRIPRRWSRAAGTNVTNQQEPGSGEAVRGADRVLWRTHLRSFGINMI